MNTFFTSDTHWGHKNIIKFCSRPYASVEEMDEAMITNWNDRVRPGDTVYHLGDFTFYRREDQQRRIIDSLNGNIKLILGNHDDDLVYLPSKITIIPTLAKAKFDGISFEL